MNVFNRKAILLSSITSLIITLLIGCFTNSPSNMDASFEREHWYYLNRGYPTAWVGVALTNSEIDFPIVKAPLLHTEDGNGTALVKIIDLSKFIPILILIFLILYFPSLFVVKIVDYNKKTAPFLVLINASMFALFLFVYFFLFSGV